jgi:uncharacterized lipoprotein NlpE involved in copper resistance
MAFTMLWGVGGCDFAKLPDEEKQETESERKADRDSDKKPVAPREQPGAGTFIELALTPPIKTERCFAEFTPPSEEGEAVVQLKSYVDPAQEAFPSVFAAAETTAASASDLVNQTVAARVYVQLDEAGNMLDSGGYTIQITINKVEGTRIEGQVAGGTLEDLASGDSAEVTGTFVAELR